MNDTPSKKQKIAETILDYWYTLEFLNQDALPGLSYEERRKNDEAVKAAGDGEKRAQTSSAGRQEPKVLKLITPIEPDTNICELAASEAKRHGMSCWGNISVYVGKIQREQCTQAIARKLQEEDCRPERSNDEIACFSIQLTPAGAYIERTFSLSPIIWAISRLEKATGKSLAQYLSHQAYKADVEAYDGQLKIWNDCTEGEPAGVSASRIAAISRQVYDEFIKGTLETDHGFSGMMMYQVFKDETERDKYEDDDYLGLGRNFFAEDLKLVLSRFQMGLSGVDSPMLESMTRYITGPYGEFYPEEALFSFDGRRDLGQRPSGDEKGSRQRTVFAEILNVQNAPLGKWPSRFMPAFMQQAAVNLAVSESADYGRIFSVNGPPGTGKTTLLKEIVVDHIVKKATYLSEYEKPDDAFEERCFLHGEKINNGYSKWYSKYYRLKDERINDCSILVTSCNNAAVENITKELPLEKGILGALPALETDSQMCKDQLEEVKTLFTAASSGQYEELYCADKEKKGQYQDIYFTEYAKSLLGGGEAWGLISAALGKKSNIHRFYQNVLFHLITDFYKNDKIAARLEQYGRIRAEFQAQKIKVERLREELSEYCRDEAYIRELHRENKERVRKLDLDSEQKNSLLNECEQQEDSLRKEAENFRAKLTEKEMKVEQLRLMAENSKRNWEETDQSYEEKLKRSIETRGSISPFGRLFHRKDAKAKHELADKFYREAQELKKKTDEMRLIFEAAQSVSDSLDAQVTSLRREMAEMDEKLRDLGQRGAKLALAVQKNREETQHLERKMTAERERCAKKLKQRLEAADVLGGFIPLDDVFMEHFLSKDEKKSTWAQVANPWFTDHYNREREKLFYLALQVNKAFILSSKCCFRNYRNLALLWQESKEDNEIVSFHSADREACFGPLLQTLFLLVPVISTTFASVGNFLRDIKVPGVLGTLIVDEAGQAPPQMAVGALYRSRRAVIVGDPKQVEPVVTDDLQLIKKAYKENIYKPYKSKTVSVQQFADLINPYGTYMENEENEKEWLGCPLVVHRRCVSPMYDISNQISYNNTMKQQAGAPSKEREKLFCYGGSQWINVKGREKGNKNHFVEAQAKRVIKILEIAFSKSDDPSLFIITPFTTVKYGMIQYLEGRLKNGDSPVLNGKRGSVKGWMYKNIGTVHTFQGKEADEVIFLLGCDTSKEAAGAIRWVSANIVNVAVTRAKYRLYVIGDETAWRESAYVRQAKSILDLYAIKELSRIDNGGQGESEEKKRERAVEFSRQLPTAEFVPIEESEEDESGTKNFEFDSEGFLGELKNGELGLSEITEEQLKGYGFTRESFQALNPRIRENIEWGIKLYSMFKKLRQMYEIEEIDASCCAILFCKALELQIKECFYEGFKKQFPDLRIRQTGGHKMIPFSQAKKKDTTIGTYWFVLRDDANKQHLATCMEALQKTRYNIAWWNQYDTELEECGKLRNSCCHCDKFRWKQMNRLLVLMFLGTGKLETAGVHGIIRESEVGKQLVSYLG